MWKYILLVLDRALRDAVRIHLLAAHRLLDDVVHLVGVGLVEGGRVRPVVVRARAVQWALRIRHLHVVLALHLPVLGGPMVLRRVLLMVLVELDHRELLLQRARSLLLSQCALLLHMLVSPLLSRRGIHHLAVVGAVLFRVGLVAHGRVSQSHLPLLVVNVAPVHVAVAAAVDDLVAVNKDQLRRVSLLNTL